MWRISVLLVSALVLLSRAEQLRYTKNSVYYASMGGFPTQSTLDRDESSKEVLKELGVDLSNEGKKKFSIFLENISRLKIVEIIFPGLNNFWRLDFLFQGKNGP